MTMVLIAIVWFGSLAQEAPAASLVRARQLERVSHEPEQAIEAYQGVIDDADGAQDARGEAALGLVRCLLKLGKSDDAVAMVMKLPATIGLPALAAQLEALVAAYQPSAPPAQDAASFQERVQALVQALDTNQAEQAKGTLRDLGEPVVPYLLAAVRTNRNEQVLTSALELLAQQARANAAGKAAEFFVGLDQEADPILVGKALNQLSGSLPERLWPTLRKLMQSELAIIKKPLITITAQRGDEESVRFVQRMMDDPDEAVRARAISTGLKTLPEAKAIALAQKIFREGDRSRQQAALSAVALRPSLPAGLVSAFESREVSVRWMAFRCTRPGSNPRIDLGSLTADQRRAVVEPASRTLRDPAIGDDDVHDLLENSDLLERLPFTAAALAPLATERGGQVPELIASWVARHVEEPGALEVAIQLGGDGSLAPVIVEKSHRNSTLTTHRLMLALVQRHGWQDAWTARALHCLWRNWDAASSEACRMILAQPEEALRRFLVAVSPEDRSWLLKGGLSSLSPESDALVERLAGGEPPLVPIADLVAHLPTGMQRLQHPKIIAMLARVYDQPNDDVTRLRAIHILKSTGDERAVFDRLLVPIAFPSMNDHNVWLHDYRDEQPELKGQSQVNSDAVRSAELRSIVRVAFGNVDTVVADLERFLSAANPNTREELVAFVLAHATDVVKRERPALREALESRLLAVLDQPDGSKAVAGAAMSALQQLHDAKGWSDATIARLLRSPQASVAISALQLAGRREVHRARVEELLASPDSTLRFNAVPVVAAYGDVAAARALAEALRDPSPGVRDVAKAALESLRLYLDEKARWEQFDARGESALTPLTALVKQTRDAQKKVRLAAIRALGAFGDQAALPHLIELLKDSDSDVQAAAEKAIDVLSTARRAGSRRRSSVAAPTRMRKHLVWEQRKVHFAKRCFEVEAERAAIDRALAIA